MKNKIFISIISALFIGQLTFAQEVPFSIKLEKLEIAQLGGLQSYAFGQSSDGKWLIVGGRLDGLHRRQPWASFDLAGHNDQLIVVDPVSKKTWKSSFTGLSVAISEQLRSTNMEFYQDNGYLYCIGGYGYSAVAQDHKTFDNLTAIEIDSVVNAIVNGKSLTPYFEQVQDTKFQVTGGRLKKIEDRFYLMGGQKFMGRYNPMGPNHGPGFIQEYTDAVHVFTLDHSGGAVSVNHIKSYQDATELHRRDYNAEAQILPDGSEGITMFSGVFRPDADLPFLTAVMVDSSGYNVQPNFKQYYNHYHCPVIPLYSANDNEMHSVFFGGIAQYYDNNGVLVQDENVPFVSTIARVTRDATGDMKEYKLPDSLPGLMGAGAEFIHVLDIPAYNNGVLKLDEIQDDNVLIGYIYGGINSSAPNIFFSNNGTQSSASATIYKVLLTRGEATSNHQLNELSEGLLSYEIYPNPAKDRVNFEFDNLTGDEAQIIISDQLGKVLVNQTIENSMGSHGKLIHTQKVRGIGDGGVYLITVIANGQTIHQKLVVE